MNKFKQGTQKQVLYDYLLAGKSITTKGAMIDLGIADLQGCIRNLKEAGVPIETIDQKVRTRYTKKDGSPKYASIRIRNQWLPVLGYEISLGNSRSLKISNSSNL